MHLPSYWIQILRQSDGTPKLRVMITCEQQQIRYKKIIFKVVISTFKRFYSPKITCILLIIDKAKPLRPQIYFEILCEVIQIAGRLFGLSLSPLSEYFTHITYDPTGKVFYNNLSPNYCSWEYHLFDSRDRICGNGIPRLLTIQPPTLLDAC